MVSLQELSQIKYFLPFDVYERHKFVGGFIKNGETVLDVGGSLGHLNKFSSAKKITTVDIEPPADIIYDGRHLPFAKKSFAAVVAIDVLEHIDKREREKFITELKRVASRLVVLSAPYGSEAHIDFEKKEVEQWLDQNNPLQFLKEHLEKGLPEPFEIRSLVNKFGGRLYFSGNFSFSGFLFRLHQWEIKLPLLNKILFTVKLIINGLINILLYPLLINLKEKDSINRFYLVFRTNK